MRRKYVVLAHDDESDSYDIAAVLEANSADQAINEVAKTSDGRWVAVPVRNWHEQDRDVEEREPVVRRKRVEPKITVKPAADEAPTVVSV